MSYDIEVRAARPMRRDEVCAAAALSSLAAEVLGADQVLLSAGPSGAPIGVVDVTVGR